MSHKIIINKKIKPFNKIIKVDGDKSISIRWLLLASQSTGTSRAYGILKSEDIFNTIKCLKKLGVKIKVKKSYCELHGVGLNGFKIKKNIKLDMTDLIISNIRARKKEFSYLISEDWIDIGNHQSLGYAKKNFK